MTRAELRAALEERGLTTLRLNPAVVERLAHRPRLPGNPVSTYFRTLLAEELERRRRNPLMSMDPMIKGAPRQVLLTEPQDEDPLIVLLNAASAEEHEQEFGYALPMLRRMRVVEPVLARGRAVAELQRRHDLLRVRIARREREMNEL